eukprot:5055058-Pleurochrysis_carterae.AAC.2
MFVPSFSSAWRSSTDSRSPDAVAMVKYSQDSVASCISRIVDARASGSSILQKALVCSSLDMHHNRSSITRSVSTDRPTEDETSGLSRRADAAVAGRRKAPIAAKSAHVAAAAIPGTSPALSTWRIEPGPLLLPSCGARE